MAYSVKEIFHTIQGEGANAGAPAVFCRFSGCNLWSGLEKDRSGAVCTFCDTDFFGTDGPGGGVFETAAALGEAIERTWKGDASRRFVVLTGGEPLLQVNDALISELHSRRFRIAVETNGTKTAPKGIDWLCVSPKAGAPLVQRSGDELKVVYPQEGLDLTALLRLSFNYFYLSPMDGRASGQNLKLITQYCLNNPQWRVGVQLHKLIGVR